VSARGVLDVLVDGSGAAFTLPADPDALAARLRDELEWACIDVHVRLALPPGARSHPVACSGLTLETGGDAANLLRSCMRRAQSHPRDLLVCTGALLPGADVIGRLRERLSTDAMFVAAVPRVALMPGGDIVALDSQAEPPALVPRGRLADLDDYYILPERVFPCMLLRGEVLAALEPPSADFCSLGAALLDVLSRARHRGFRVVVDNRAVIPAESAERASPPPMPAEDVEARAEEIDEPRAPEPPVGRHQGAAMEELLAVAGSRPPRSPRSALLDCTGMQDVFNGTSISTLGLLDGFHRLGTPRWQITVMAQPCAERFFGLSPRYPRFRVVGSDDRARHAVALRLSQVWSLATWADLHQRALSIGVSILDTIALDILYTLSHGVPEAFQFTAEHADGLLYISQFSRDQFRRRFRVPEATPELVHYLSFDPRDYAPGEPPPPAAKPFVLVIGNEYDHKDVAPTAQVLAEAFPFLEVRALGLRQASLPNVQALTSGSLPEDLLEQLYGQATCVVYPSYYEGFGLPLVKALANGRTVIARRSPLLSEMAARLPPGGRLLAFSTRLELVEALGTVLHGTPTNGLELGTALAADAAPLSWVSIARTLADFMDELAAHPDPERWRRRDNALRLVAAVRGS
jgi:glycosyltransferase involved in cell wall biosynthesis